MSIHRVRYDNPMSILWVFYDSEMRYPVVFLLHNGLDPTFTYNGNQVTKIEDSENNGSPA